MAFCPNCGTENQGNFCAKCGSAMGTAGATAQAGGAPPPPPAAPAASGLDENVASALCYLAGLITGVIFLVLAPYNTNRTIRFHAFQAIFFHIGLIVLGIAVAIGMAILAFIPFVGNIVFIAWPLFYLGVIALWIMLMVKAYNRERLVLPVVGPMAEKQANA